MFKRIDHIEIVPSNVEKTLDFYQTILGFNLKNRVQVDAPPMKEVIYLKLGDTMIEVISAEKPAMKSPVNVAPETMVSPIPIACGLI